MNGGAAASDEAALDAERVRGLAGGDDACLRELYARHAPWIFALALRSLERASAEEIVQDVFVAVWRNAARFDPERGTVRGWLSVIAQRRIANEQRGRGRRPKLEAQDAGGGLEAVDPSPGPAGLAWLEYRRAAVRSALETLPHEQRQALGLAFLEELTHEQVAELLGLRLGTAKSRIRTALQKLRGPLAPLVAMLALLAVAGAAGIALRERGAASLDERAIEILTSSEVVPLRLEPTTATDSGMHATYRARAGTPLAVLTYTHFPAAPADATYQAWARHGSVYTSIGSARPDADGRARIIAEGSAFAEPPEGLLVTLEPGSGSSVPTGPVIVTWPKP